MNAPVPSSPDSTVRRKKPLLSLGRLASPIAVLAPPVRLASRMLGLSVGRRLNLALQGGGAHGAFTWGVLDGLLDDSRLEIEGISGSSAGAMNAVLMSQGWMDGGRTGARDALARFWSEVGRQMPTSMVKESSGGSEIRLSAAGKWLSGWAANFSPSQLNPFDLNPLRDLLLRHVDFAGLRTRSPFKLFIGATEANTGKLRVFRERELSVDVLLASACLPKLHHPIEIDGTPYWDGGYSANPAVFPLFYECRSADVLLVLLSPLQHADTPRSVKEIDTRITELGFSAHFMREMRMFAAAKRYAGPSLLGRGRLERRLHQMRFHLIDSDEVPSLERSDTKQLAYGPFLEQLKTVGRARAVQWLEGHAACIGQRSSIDMEQLFS